MKDLFADLLERSRGRAPLVPVLPARFEPAPEGAETLGEVETWVPAPTPRLRAAGATPVGEEAPRARSRAVTPIEPAPPVATPWPVEGHEPGGTPGDDIARSVPTPRAEIPLEPALDLAAIVGEALSSRVAPLTEPETRPRAAERTDPDARGEAESRPGATVVMTERAPLASTVPARGEPHEARSEPARVEVRIGRIEVTAPPAPRPAPVVRPSRPAAPALSLGGYLAKRGRR